MRRRDALREGVRILAEEGPGVTDTPSLDASLLLAKALSTTKEGLIASLPEEIAETDYSRFLGLLDRRLGGLPVAYLLGRKDFWGQSFLVDERVLIPRPDTELLVELGLSLGDELASPASATGGGPGDLGLRRRSSSLLVHELCTGSGCVALSLALERPTWKVSASDLSREALTVAEANALALIPPGRPGGPVELFQADLLIPLTAGGPGPQPEASYDLILANPPYVESPQARELAAQWQEPLLALDGGPDGLDPYRRLIPQAFGALAPGGSLLVEADPSQAPALLLLFTEAGFLAIKSVDDLSGLARVTLGRKPWMS